MRRLIPLLLLAVSPLPLASAAAQTEAAAPALLDVPKLQFTKRILANGATLYAIRDTATATVSINIWYDVGQRDDPPGRGGFAHLFEHLMFKTTRNLPGGVQIGRAHVRTPVTNAHLVCRLLLEKKNIKTANT